jgi:hypothetical protein
MLVYWPIGSRQHTQMTSQEVSAGEILGDVLPDGMYRVSVRLDVIRGPLELHAGTVNLSAARGR